MSYIQIFSEMAGKPTSLSGYGITDGVLNTTTVNGHVLSSNVTVSKSDVGLSNADNTADSAKPISTATQTALNLLVPQSTTINGHALSGNVSVTTTDLSLQNVNNTSDVAKPVSTAQQAALDLKQTLNAYKSYQGIVTQLTTSAPSSVVLNNDFSPTTLTFARTGAGIFTITANTAIFTANKTVVVLSLPLVGLVTYIATITSTTVITLTSSLQSVIATVLTSVPTDSLFTNTLVEIRVYN